MLTAHRKLLYSRREGAHLLNISEKMFDHLAATRVIETVRIGKRVLVSADALSEFVKRRSAAGPTAAHEEPNR